MAKRGDNIRKRKDGRWEGRYKKGRAADGSIIYGSVYGKTYKEVKEKMASIISHPLQLATPKGQGKTFGEVLNLWMDNNRARLKGGTINKYQNLIDTHIMPELGLTKVNELSATRINTFLDEKISRGRVDGSGGLSASYVRSIMLVINAAIKYAVSEQLCSPLKTPICKPSVDKTELSILSSEEQNKLIEYYKNNGASNDQITKVGNTIESKADLLDITNPEIADMYYDMGKLYFSDYTWITDTK